MAKTSVAIAVEALAEKLVGVDVTELPAVSGSDNGKALMVSGGKWVAGAIPSQLPAVTAADAGMVLTVNAEGQWVAAALPEG